MIMYSPYITLKYSFRLLRCFIYSRVITIIGKVSHLERYCHPGKYLNDPGVKYNTYICFFDVSTVHRILDALNALHS